MIDHDRLFKELITTFFWEFLELFLPEVLIYMERDTLTFLPQEIFTDVTSGNKREVDLLAQVKFQDQDSCFLIHLENQSSSEAEFTRRMFHYFARLDEKYRLPIYPVVIFSFDEPKRGENNEYLVLFPDREVLKFSFVSIQLNRLNWRDYLRNPSPIAAALMAKMQFSDGERARVKLECLRMIATLKLDPARTQLISGFVDSYLRLNEVEESQFQTELKSLGLVEEEQVMEIVTSWMEKGIERGIQQGIQQGIQSGEKTLVLRQLNRRLGAIPEDLTTEINNLSLEKIESLGEALLDFEKQEDLLNWLEVNRE